MKSYADLLVTPAANTLFNRISLALILFSFAIPATAFAIAFNWSPM